MSDEPVPDDTAGSTADAPSGAVRRLLARDPALAAVLLTTLFALAARLFWLGDRIAHWDEGRVAYWIVDYTLTRSYEYRPIIHGPFYHHVNDVLFALFGATDFAMRLAPAIIGGLLPLSALLLRERLRDVEVVGVALFLAFNPVLLYYSRFMRGDLPVGAFMFVGFALFVRAIDVYEPDGGERFASRRVQALVVAGLVAVALGFTVKENALAYLAAWVGALALVFDLRLLTARFGDGARSELIDRVRAGVRGVVSAVPGIVAGLLLLLVVVVFFYAPRGDSAEVAFGRAIANPTLLPGVVEEATVGSWQSFWSQWVAGGTNEHPYLPYLGDLAKTLVYGALAVLAFGFVGFLLDRYGRRRHRALVAFCFFWGFASIFGYPLITDIRAPWAAVHIVLPMTIPAGVAVGLFWDLGSAAYAKRDQVDVALVSVVALLVVAQVGFTAATAVYLDPSSADNELVQYAQPADDFHPTIAEMERLAADHEGVDVVLYGEFLYQPTGGGGLERRPTCSKWFNALPLPWYFERPAYGGGERMNVSCAKNNTQATPLFEGPRSEDPPIVIAKAKHTDTLNESFPEYDLRVHQIRTTDTRIAFYVDTDR